MNRRGFFGLLPMTAAALVPGFSSGLTKSKKPYWEFDYKGYHLRFTGWKTNGNDTRLVAQWFAVPTDEQLAKDGQAGAMVYIYASDPGTCDFYCRGYTFNIARERDDFGRPSGPIPLSAETATDDDKADRKAELLKRICAFIDANGYEVK